MHVDINPKVLEWAFRYAQADPMSLAHRFPHYQEWINQTKEPTVKQLEEVAEYTHVPLGYLFLSEVPQIYVKPVKDFRTIQNKGVRAIEYSPELRDTILMMRERQEWLSEYKKEHFYDKLDWVGSITTDMSDEMILFRLHQTLQIPQKWFELKDSKKNVLLYFISHIENAGAVVFLNSIVGNNTRRKLKVNEFRGFALVDDYAPLIFINGADKGGGRLFTLIHELVHLFLGQDGLDDGTEVFCNRITAEFLVPSNVFLEKWKTKNKNFEALESYFHVSKLVLYRIALTFKLITYEKWKRLHFGFLKQFQQDNNEAKEPKVNFNVILPNRIGRSFSRYVFNAVQEGDILYKDAYRLLGIQGKTFQNAAKKAGEA